MDLVIGYGIIGLVLGIALVADIMSGAVSLTDDDALREELRAERERRG